VKKNIKECVNHEVILEYYGQNKVFVRGQHLFVDFNGVFSSINETKEDKRAFSELNYGLQIN